MKKIPEHWQRVEGQPVPSWITFDLDEQCIPFGYWIINHELDDHFRMLSPEQFAEEFQ